MEKAQEALPSGPQVKYMHDIYSAVQGVDAALILTDWNVFSRLDLQRLKEAVRCPIVVDGRNLYDPQTMVESGIIYVSLGRPTMDITEEPLLLARLA